ncbi:TatD family hydrolase [bacterium]|nr:TatD family hydrolase [bacterium]
MSKSASLTDSHCHLTAAQFDDLSDVLLRARAAGVEAINVIGYTLEHSLRAINIAGRSDGLWATVGISPHDAKDAPADYASGLRELARSSRAKVVAVGETGLDFYHLISPKDVQIEAFRTHIELAEELNLPLVIHTRDAFEETVNILNELDAPAVGGVFHCFTGAPDEALRAVELGFYVSFSGIITFKNASVVRASAAVVPDSRLLVETDAPYLAPAPKRGKRNEPAFLVHVVRELAKIRGRQPDDIAAVTTENAQNLFRYSG